LKGCVIALKAKQGDLTGFVCFFCFSHRFTMDHFSKEQSSFIVN